MESEKNRGGRKDFNNAWQRTLFIAFAFKKHRQLINCAIIDFCIHFAEIEVHQHYPIVCNTQAYMFMKPLYLYSYIYKIDHHENMLNLEAV